MMFLPEMRLPNWVLLPSWTVGQLELLLLLFFLSLFFLLFLPYAPSIISKLFIHPYFIIIPLRSVS